MAGETARFTATPEVFCTRSWYEVAPETAFHVYAGVVVAIVPEGETVVGAAGGVTLQFPPTVPVPVMRNVTVPLQPAVIVICVGVPPPSVTANAVPPPFALL
jgi:hypothetical protein